MWGWRIPYCHHYRGEERDAEAHLLPEGREFLGSLSPEALDAGGDVFLICGLGGCVLQACIVVDGHEKVGGGVVAPT